MIDLGNMPGMYNHPTSTPVEPEKNYPCVCLPMAILDGKKYQVGDKVYIELNGTIESMRMDQYSSDVMVRLKEGELESQAEEDSETPADEKAE